ncbi:MAG: HlyD family efflux transporter periplasmic adaptor subunit, partial [Hyphomicrobiaceae bacterium]
PAFTDPDSQDTKSYPFAHIVWQPLRIISGQAFASIIFAREKPWTEQDVNLIARESDVFGDRWQALYGKRVLRAPHPMSWSRRLLIAAAVVTLAFAPVPMTTLAPVEIVAKSPQRVTAPIDGIIKDIKVEPNDPVHIGQVILNFDETTASNRLEIAEHELLLARAKLETTRQAAFQDEKARRELSATEAEFNLKKSERDYAAELLAKSFIIAKRDGILVYESKDQWIGKPVRTGERIMQIVRPNMVMAKIELPVADSIVLGKRTQARLFLDADPLTSVHATLVNEAYQAEPNSTRQLVFRLLADIDINGQAPRIGSRGTAQLRGENVPLIFFLLHRPLSVVRQHLGI